LRCSQPRKRPRAKIIVSRFHCCSLFFGWIEILCLGTVAGIPISAAHVWQNGFEVCIALRLNGRPCRRCSNFHGMAGARKGKLFEPRDYWCNGDFFRYQSKLVRCKLPMLACTLTTENTASAIAARNSLRQPTSEA